jgi:hypothetical protein
VPGGDAGPRGGGIVDPGGDVVPPLDCGCVREGTINTPPDPCADEAPPEPIATTGSCEGSESLKSRERSGASHPQTVTRATATSTDRLPARATAPYASETTWEDVRIKTAVTPVTLRLPLARGAARVPESERTAASRFWRLFG